LLNTAQVPDLPGSMIAIPRPHPQIFMHDEDQKLGKRMKSEGEDSIEGSICRNSF
jgi:hypothetical protein